MNAVKILIADDRSMMREGLKCLIESEEEFQVIAEVENVEQCLEQMLKWEPDLILLEICMRDQIGVDILRMLYSECERDVKVLVLAGTMEMRFLIEAFRVGVDGILMKTAGFDELKRAISKVIGGEKYIQEELKLDDVNEEWEMDKDRIGRLTKRELEILKNLAVGMYNKEIAMKLAISERTVKNHVSNIFKKIGVADRTQAAVIAIRNHLVDI